MNKAIYNQQYYQNNKDKHKAWRRAYYLSHKDIQKAQTQAYRKSHKKTVVEHYGNKCSCPKCPESNPLFLTIDHINTDGAKQRKIHSYGDEFYRWIIEHNFPVDLRLMCWNCNSGRHYNGGVCPHLC